MTKSRKPIESDANPDENPFGSTIIQSMGGEVWCQDGPLIMCSSDNGSDPIMTRSSTHNLDKTYSS
jgi:hypothetical protein